MTATQEQFFDLYRAGLENMVAMARTTLDEAERLRAKQLESIRDALAENADLGRAIASAASAEELYAAQGKFVTHQIDVALGYWGKLFETASRTQLEAMKRLGDQASQFNQRLETVLGETPAGAEPLVAAMKALMETARAAYGVGAQATEQAVKLTEAQFTTATAGIRQAVTGTEKKSA